MTKYVKLTLGNEGLGTEYDYRHFFTSDCTIANSKYLCLSNAGNLPAYFKMNIFDNNRCSFQFYDGPYKGQWMHHDGGYLYVGSTYDYLAGDFRPDVSAVKLWTIQGGVKRWFKKGSKYKNDYCGNYYYVVTTTNESEAIELGVEDVSGLIGERPPRATRLKKAYIFKGDQYIQFDIATDKADAGYPKPIKGNWPGLENLTRPVDAIVDINRDKIYFFSGSQYIRYDAATALFDAEWKPINGGDWPGLEPFAGGIDAAVSFTEGKIYFFKGTQYIAYDTVAGRAFDGYPTTITDNWHGVEPFASGIDAAVNIGDGKVYLFKGPNYIRYDIATDRAETAPLPITRGWPGLDAFASGIDGSVAF